MRKTIKLTLLAFLLASCAAPTVVKTTKVSDNSLSCEQLVSEIKEAETFEKKARDERKVTGKNVAAALFFWPALIGTYSNTEDAIDAAQERQKNLMNLYNKKGCQ